MNWIADYIPIWISLPICFHNLAWCNRAQWYQKSKQKILQVKWSAQVYLWYFIPAVVVEGFILTQCQIKSEGSLKNQVWMWKCVFWFSECFCAYSSVFLGVMCLPQADFMALEMRNGKVSFLWDAGSGHAKIDYPDVQINNNKWQRINATR